MAAPNGPDDETWKGMSKTARLIYWVVHAAITGWILYLFLR
jgi:hypothetical protein